MRSATRPIKREVVTVERAVLRRAQLEDAGAPTFERERHEMAAARVRTGHGFPVDGGADDPRRRLRGRRDRSSSVPSSDEQHGRPIACAGSTPPAGTSSSSTSGNWISSGASSTEWATGCSAFSARTNARSLRRRWMISRISRMLRSRSADGQARGPVPERVAEGRSADDERRDEQPDAR